MRVDTETRTRLHALAELIGRPVADLVRTFSYANLDLVLQAGSKRSVASLLPSSISVEQARTLGDDDARRGLAPRVGHMATVPTVRAYASGYREGWQVAMDAGRREPMPNWDVDLDTCDYALAVDRASRKGDAE